MKGLKKNKKKSKETETNFAEEWTKIEHELFKKSNKTNKNICLEFRIDGSINEMGFISDMNEKQLTYLFDKINDLNNPFKNDMVTAIKKGNTIIINIFGQLFSGKSYVGITIGKFIQKKVNEIHKNTFSNLHIVFDGFELKKLFPTLHNWDVVIIDENPKRQGEGSTKSKWNIDNILKIGRKKQIFFIFIEPLIQPLKVCYFYLETAGKNENTRITRLILYGSNRKPRGCVYIPILNDDNPFMINYEKNKTENIEKLFNDSGKVEKKIDKKKTFKHNTLISSTLKYDINQSFSSFCRDNIKGEKMGIVAESLTRGDAQKTINENYPDISLSFIKKNSIILRNRGSESVGLGYLFERWVALKILKIPEEKIEEILGGSTRGKPDIIWNNNIYSLKFRLIGTKTTYKFSQEKDFFPEFKEAKKQNKKYNLIFMCPNWSLDAKKIELDPNEDDSIDLIVKNGEIYRYIREKNTTVLVS